MKVYAMEETLVGDCGVEEQTFMKWSWMFVEEISKMAKLELSFWRNKMLLNFPAHYY